MRTPVRTVRLDLSALERDRRKLVDLQEVGGPKVVVPLLVVGADARGIDGYGHGRAPRLVRVEIPGCREFGKVTANGHHPEMLRRKLDLGVHRIELPGPHSAPPPIFDCLGQPITRSLLFASSYSNQPRSLDWTR